MEWRTNQTKVRIWPITMASSGRLTNHKLSSQEGLVVRALMACDRVKGPPVLIFIDQKVLDWILFVRLRRKTY